MPIRVAWHGDALDQLASLWMQTDDRAGITEASGQIDIELSEQPLMKSRPAGDRLYSFRVLPLEVLFDFRPDNQVVEVVAVREVRPDRN